MILKQYNILKIKRLHKFLARRSESKACMKEKDSARLCKKSNPMAGRHSRSSAWVQSVPRRDHRRYNWRMMTIDVNARKCF